MARLKRFSYDDYNKPLEEMQKTHNETLADMANMSATADLLDFYLDPNDPDSQESYALYNNFKNEFNKQVDDFAKNGLTQNNGMNLLNLHRNYNTNISNVLDALKLKKTEEAAQMSAQEKSNGQMVYSSYANRKGVDSYLHGQMGYDQQNLDEVHKFAKNEAAAASKRKYQNNLSDAVRVLGNNYYNILEKEGYNTEDSYKVINNLLTDMETQLSGGTSPTADGDDKPDGFIRNMRAELQKRGIENYSEEDRRKIIDAFLTGTYEGLSYDEKNKQLETPEMKAKGRSVTSVTIAPPTEKVDPTDFNENEIGIGSSFEDESSDRKRTRFIEDLSKPTNYCVKQVKTVNGYEQRLSSPQEYAQQQFDFRVRSGEYFTKPIGDGKVLSDEKGNPIYFKRVITGASHAGDVHYDDVVVTPKLDDKKQKDYDDYVDNLAKNFYLSEEQKNAIKNGAFIKPILEQASKEIANMKKAVAQPAYELIIPGDQNGSVLSLTWNRAKSGNNTGAHTGLKYNQYTGEYSFENKVDSDTLKKIYNPDVSADQRKGMLIQLVYAPQTYLGKDGHTIKGDLFQVAFSSTEWDEPIFFPLSAFASQSNAEWVKQVYQAQQRSKIMIDALKEQLGCTNDAELISEINEQIRIGNLQQDFLKKQILRKTSERGQIKSNNQFKDVFDADIKTLEPIKYKNKQYKKPNNEVTENGEED